MAPALPERYLVHPRTAELLFPLGVTKHGKPIWPVAGGSGEDDDKDPPKDEPTKQQDPPSDRGYPENTPLAEMTVEQREQYWIHKSRKHEQRLKDLGDVDELQKKAGQYDALAKASQTEQERAVEAAKAEARAEARAEALKEHAPRLVGAEFRVQAAGRLTAEQVKELIEDLDMTKYLTDSGEVDVDRVRRKVDALAPAKQEEKNLRRQPDMGQGRREPDKSTGVAAGRDMFDARRRPAKTS